MGNTITIISLKEAIDQLVMMGLFWISLTVDGCFPSSGSGVTAFVVHFLFYPGLLYERT